MIPVETLATVFVETADTLVDDFDIIEFLSVVTERAAHMSDARAAGLVLADPHGNLQFVAASEESVELLELLAIQNEEGPCYDCFQGGEPIFDTQLSRAQERWPRFAPDALAVGFEAVHALPLRHRRTVIGVLNLFSTKAEALDPADVRVIQALADIATIGILQERTIRAGEVLTEQLQVALTSRITIEQAKGALSRMRRVGVDEAFVIMREYARSHHHRLSDVAAAVVTDPARHPQLTHVTSDLY